MNRSVALLTVIAALGLSACEHYEIECDPLISSSEPGQSVPEFTSSLKEIAIHIDGSGSMLGYVANPNSRYVQLLKNLDTIAEGFNNQGGGENNNPTVQVKYYRSGTNVNRTGEPNQEISRSDFRNAQNEEFYSSGKFPGVSSALAASIRDTANTFSEEGHLFMMVTDLNQDENDVNDLSSAIKDVALTQKSAAKDYAVGILATKSEFSGRVYMTDQNISNFDYSTQSGEPDTFRPVYVLLLGRYQDIKNFFENLDLSKNENLEALLEDSHAVIFTPNNIITDPWYIGEAEIIDQLPPGLYQIPSLYNPVAVELDETQEDQFQLLEIENYINEKLSIQYKVNWEYPKNVLPINPEGIEVGKVSIQSFDKFEKEFVDGSDDSKALQIRDWKNAGNTDNQYNFELAIDPEQLPEPNIYVFQFDIVAKSLGEQEWWQEWDWERSKVDNQDGSKTLGLYNFMHGLGYFTSTLMSKEGNSPIIARLCYGIQKN